MQFPNLIQSDWEQIVNNALTTISQSSGGRFSDFSIHSPVRALIEGVTWVTEDYSYRLNQLPVAIISQWLSYWGLSPNAATKAKGTVTLFFSPMATDLVIPAGTRFVSGNSGYLSTVAVTLAAYGSSVSVPVESESTGANYNLPVNAVNAIDPSNPLSGIVNSVTSTEMSGGRDATDGDEHVVETLRLLTSNRTLVTASDFETAIKTLIPGSRAVIVPFMGADAMTVDLPGHVHCFVLVPGYRGINATESANLIAAMQPLLPIGIKLHISPVTLREVSVRVIVSLESIADPVVVYEGIRANILRYVDPYRFEGTALLYKELEYAARNVPGVKTVGGAYVSELGGPPNTEDMAVNMPTSHPRELFNLIHLSVSLLKGGIEYNLGDSFIPDEIPDTQTIINSISDDLLP